ncbi:cuticle protein 10.9-like [Ornithodoros turicata]|uniref:cuticle protein 10.9-like n=1 Tax=Ornithodoros turicata TaxID=34597 RepID=UPI00313A1857
MDEGVLEYKSTLPLSMSVIGNIQSLPSQLKGIMFAQVLLATLLGYAAAGVPAYRPEAAFGYGAPLVAAPAVLKGVEAEPAYPPQPYEFGYDTVDEYGTRQSRQESSDNANQKKGSYSYTDANGIFRQVHYVADADGFRATIHTNEPGTASGETGGALYDAKPVEAKEAVKSAAAYAAPSYAAPGYLYGKY